MKNTGMSGLALVVCLTTLITACGGIFDSDQIDADPIGHKPGVDQSTGVGKGRLVIYLPAVSPYIQDALVGKSGSKALPRALMFASRAELELRDARGALVDQWTVQALSGMDYSNGSVGAIDSREVLAGSGYILSAKVYNDQVSVTEAMLAGSVGNITIIAGSGTGVSIPCIPAASIATLLSVGTVTGSLVPGMLSGSAFTAIGGEAWYKFEPGSGKTRVSFTLSSDASFAYAAIYRTDGTWMNQSAAPTLGSSSSASVPVIPGQTYYIGVALFDASAAPTAYTLSLAESATGPDIVPNGDFSSGTAGWTLRVPGPATASLDAPLVGQSTTNKELKATVADTAPYLGIVLDRRDLSIEAGKTYLLGFRAKVSSGTAAISLGLGYMDGSTLVSYGQAYGGNQAQYYRYYENAIAVTGASTSEGVVYARVFSSDVQNLEFYLDDITLVDVTTTMSAPTNLNAVQDAVGKGVTISWNAVDGATSYDLSRTGGGRSGSATVDGTSFDDTSSGLIGNWYGIEYHYSVAAKDANGTGTAAIVAFTRSAKPVSGSVVGSGLAAGDYPLVIFDDASNLYMSQIVTLDSEGSGTFSINGGEFVPELRFKAWIDTGTGPDSSYWINTGDRVCWVYNFDNYSVEDGTITDMSVGDIGWTEVGNIPVLAEAIRLDSTTVKLAWQDKMNRGVGGLDGVMIERNENGSAYSDITNDVLNIDCLMDPAARFNARSCTDEDVVDGSNYRYRIGFDANGNNILDPDEYAQTDGTDS